MKPAVVYNFVLRKKRLSPRWCLEMIGVRDLPRWNYWHQRRLRSSRLERLPWPQLWDLWEAARAGYRAAVKRLHPDHGGHGRKFADVTFCWKYLKGWFARLGVGT